MFALKLHIIRVLQDGADTAMADIIEPSPVPFTFDTVGWKVVFALVGLLVLFIAYRLYRNYKKKQYLRDAVAQIKTLQQQKELDTAAFINGVMFQLKQTALQSFGRAEVAGLYGGTWLQFLDDKGNGSNFKADESVILDAVYKEDVSDAGTFNKDAFITKSINWIQHHAR